MSRALAYGIEAVGALWRNRTRSILTMIGMAIGTASVIAVLGLSQAANGGIITSLASFGSTGIEFSVDDGDGDPAAAQLQYRDAAFVFAALGGAAARVYPTYEYTYPLIANEIAYNATVSSEADDPGDTTPLSAGRRIDSNDIEQATHVCVLTHSLAVRFFGSQSPLDRPLRIGGSRFRVVGVYGGMKGSLIAANTSSDYIDIPYTTYHLLAPGPPATLFVVPRNPHDAARIEARVKALLVQVHGPAARYAVQDVRALLDQFALVTNLLAIGLGAIGGISLLVAGIGIANIMLVSVTERTREIGLRKAIGATYGDVVMQFLLEAVILSVLGGAVGLAAGGIVVLIGAQTIATYVGSAPVPFIMIAACATGVSLAVGVGAGLAPAMRAGRIDPIAALHA